MSLEKIHVYHTNDLHSYLGNWPKVVSYIKQQRKLHNLQKEDMLLFDIGDHADRAHVLTEGTKGAGNVALLNEAGYDNVTIGNNEGITFPTEDLDSLYKDAKFNVLLANLFYENGERPAWAKPYEIHHLNNGIKVGVIGATIPFSAFYKMLRWKAVDPFELLPSLIQEVRKQADIVILLSHLGYYDDLQIAEKLEGIDVILGGHTHHVLQHGKNVKGTLIAQAGKFGFYVGEVTMSYDTSLKQLVSCEAACVAVESIKNDGQTEELVKKWTKKGQDALKETVIALEEPLEVSWKEPSPFTKLLAQSVKEWCGAEISMVNAGLLLKSLPKGIVTKEDLHRVCPHPINPCKVKLKGSELKEIILQALTDEMVNLQVKGFGFRGEMMGAMIYDGIEVKAERLEDGLLHASSISVLGKPINADKIYDVATVDMFTFGHLYPSIAHAKDKTYYLPEMLREILAWKFMKTTLSKN
ncbi:bifunctional metallophosphatase/5'-nucleotidase [Bacillus taeanensis]|uniref:Bifunctional metallophosphatase/5'-nucleotidase n=1 Tax=Bacillus taeanensis TaxID=273032 RepID=A0A366Y1L8_9BACI|nr:bifunctional UDP-sugar hydrolase/5'-nucleotidase [Bacillus taeanensis]RBW71275.1 bifunctional metallophosphatase/5'-nucleotidase [Bacillus taeanensis]